MAETSINHLTQLVTLIEGVAYAHEDQPNVAQAVCATIVQLPTFQDAVLWLEENLPGFKERRENA